MICECGHRHRGRIQCPNCDCEIQTQVQVDNMLEKIWKKIKSWFV